MVGSYPEVVADALLTLFFLFGPPKSAKLDAAYRGGTPMELFFARPRSVETSRKRKADLMLRDEDMQSDTFINNSYGTTSNAGESGEAVDVAQVKNEL
uniref:Movement protein n=1 Tax=Angiostrongylus cantonensis TaxID=6313 RepID=A0A0K0CX55_ANGCA